MALEKITIGKIKAPDVLYFVSFDGDENVYKDQARQMKEFFDHKQGKVRPPSFIKRLILLDLESIPERYGGWNVRAHVIIQGLVGINQRIKTYAVVKRSEKRTYYGDLVVHFQSESEKSKFLKEYLTKTFHPKGNLFSLRKIYIQEELAVSTDTDCFVTVNGNEDGAKTKIRTSHPKATRKLVSDGHRLIPDYRLLPENDLRHIIEAEKKKLVKQNLEKEMPNLSIHTHDVFAKIPKAKGMKKNKGAIDKNETFSKIAEQNSKDTNTEISTIISASANKIEAKGIKKSRETDDGYEIINEITEHKSKNINADSLLKSENVNAIDVKDSTNAESLHSVHLHTPIKMDTSNSDHTVVVFDTYLRNFNEKEKKSFETVPPKVMTLMSKIRQNCSQIYTEKQTKKLEVKNVKNNDELQGNQFDINKPVEKIENNRNEVFAKIKTTNEVNEDRSKDTDVNENSNNNLPKMPSLAFVKDISLIVELPPSQLIWWNDKSKLVFEISFRGVIDTVELSESNLFIRVESDYFSIQYLTCKTVVCINNAKFKESVIPSHTKWNLNGLTLKMIMNKVEEKFWDASTPFLTENNQPFKRNWIKLNPMKVPNDEEDIINNSETFPDLSSEEITKNALFTASWGEDYISDDEKNYHPSEDSESDESILKGL